jgi:hypothetical protein
MIELLVSGKRRGPGLGSSKSNYDGVLEKPMITNEAVIRKKNCNTKQLSFVITRFFT